MLALPPLPPSLAPPPPPVSLSSHHQVPGDERPVIIHSLEPINQQHRNQRRAQGKREGKEPITYPGSPAVCSAAPEVCSYEDHFTTNITNTPSPNCTFFLSFFFFLPKIYFFQCIINMLGTYKVDPLLFLPQSASHFLPLSFLSLSLSSPSGCLLQHSGHIHTTQSGYILRICGQRWKGLAGVISCRCTGPYELGGRWWEEKAREGQS